MTQLAVLGTETWGERLRRARERSGLTLREAEARLRPVLKASYKTLDRLEDSSVSPAGSRREHLAYLAVLAYGYDPADFGLADTPTARMIDQAAVLELLGPMPVRQTTPGLVRSTLRKVRRSAATRHSYSSVSRRRCDLDFLPTWR